MYLNHVSYTFRYVKDELVYIGLYVEELKACKIISAIEEVFRGTKNPYIQILLSNFVICQKSSVLFVNTMI